MLSEGKLCILPDQTQWPALRFLQWCWECSSAVEHYWASTAERSSGGQVKMSSCSRGTWGRQKYVSWLCCWNAAGAHTEGKPGSLPAGAKGWAQQPRKSIPKIFLALCLTWLCWEHSEPLIWDMSHSSAWNSFVPWYLSGWIKTQ